MQANAQSGLEKSASAAYQLPVTACPTSYLLCKSDNPSSYTENRNCYRIYRQATNLETVITNLYLNIFLEAYRKKICLHLTNVLFYKHNGRMHLVKELCKEMTELELQFQ